MTRIVIACDSFLALRNVRNAGLGTQLKAQGYRVTVLVDPHQLAGSRRAAVPDVEIEALLDFSVADVPPLARTLAWMELSRKSFKDPVTFLSKLQYRLAGRRLMKYAVIPQLALGWGLGWLGMYRRYRAQATDLLRATPQYNTYCAALAADAPRLVAGFSPEGYREMALMQASIDLGIPTAIMIRSRDNLVSKILFLPAADEFMVWSGQQRDYFYHLYPDLRVHPVNVVGSPQFSRHLDPTFRLSRDVFFQKIDLDPQRPLVVFCLENPSVVPHQHHMARALAQAFADGRIAHNAQLLIRTHPRAFGSDYDPLGGQVRPGIAVYPAPTVIPFGEHDGDLVRWILEDEPMHLATMAYQDVNVNIMSTVIVDSAIMDKPIVNYAFDVPPDTPRSSTVKRFFKRTDYRVVERFGATIRAASMDQLVEAINTYLNNPALHRAERAAFAAQEIGVSGEPSNHAVAALLSRMAESISPHPTGEHTQ